MSNNETIPEHFVGGPNGTRLPNPEAFGFVGKDWKPLQKLVEEHHRVRMLSKEEEARGRELENDLERLKDSEIDEMALAIRGGKPEPDGKAIRNTEKALEESEKKARALALALDNVNGDILRAISEHRERWDDEVSTRASEEAARVEAALAELRAAQAALSAATALREWLQRPGQGFAYAGGPATVDLWDSQGIKTGEVFDALVADARGKIGG